MELSTKSYNAPADHPLYGWTIMDPGDLLRYYETGKIRPQRGLQAWNDGAREGVRGGSVNVYGVTRTGDGFHTVLTSIALDTSGISAKAVAKLKAQAEGMGVPFDDADPDIAHLGVAMPDLNPRDMATKGKAIGMVIEFEDKMVEFITGARDAGLLTGVAIGVHNINQLKV